MTNVEMFQKIADSGEPEVIKTCINNFEIFERSNGLKPDAQQCLTILRKAQTQ